ncbi:MAG: FHA domain-containing protein, partial [Planctomycetes bacterium]|nr:FHA domain-containing protein [Planctomycetota bacterium]
MATLYVLQGPDKGRTFQTTDEVTLLGRDSDEVPFTDHSISRRHAELRKENGAWMIQDIHSSNGTFVNGERIQEATPIKHGDQIRIGSTLMVFSGEESVEQFTGSRLTRDLVELDADSNRLESSILASAPTTEDSIILAAPETADAVHAWNIMYQLAETIGTLASADEFLERVTDIIFGQMRVDRIFILMREAGADEFQPRVVRYRTKKKGERTKITTSKRIINHVVKTKEGILCANAQTEMRFGANAKDGSIHRLGLRSVICVPIITHDEVVGIIHLDTSMANHTYTQQQLHLATAIGKMTGMAIENARLIQSRVKHERLAAVGETMAHLSHHIRNILQGMRSGADVVEMGLRRQSLEKVGAGWQIVQRNLERTYRLALNMLTFSKERQPQIEMAQLNTVVQDAINLTQRQVDDKGVMLLSDLEDLPAAPLDVDGILQVAT